MLVCQGKSIEESTLSTDWSLIVWATGERMLWEPYLEGLSEIRRERHTKKERLPAKPERIVFHGFWREN